MSEYSMFRYIIGMILGQLVGKPAVIAASKSLFGYSEPTKSKGLNMSLGPFKTR